MIGRKKAAIAAPRRSGGDRVKIAAYQFAVSSNVKANMATIEKAVLEAKDRRTDLIVFPECALTGYPPKDMASSARVDFDLVEACCKRLRELCRQTKVTAVVGMIAKEESRIYNRAVFFSPENAPVHYDKRALWGWDRDNFVPGNRPGIVDYKGFRIGVRICFEVRFPEYFRELYKAKTDADLVLFYDASDADDTNRYSLIKGHLQTRAVENVCPVVSVNTIHPFQTAPTAVFGRSGQIMEECQRNREGFVEFDLEKKAPDFGETGRKEITDALLL